MTAHREVLDRYRQWLRAGDRPLTTINLRCYHIARLGRTHDLLEVSGQDLITWMASHDWGTETLRSYGASFRGFYQWTHHSGLTPTNPALDLPRVRTRPGIPRPAAEEVITAAIAAAEPRVRLMIRLQAQAGLRRGEVARVHSRDLHQDLDGWSLRILGKGDRERMVPLQRVLAAELRALPYGWAFSSPAGGHLTPAHVGKLVSRALGPGVVPHQLRHRFATRVYAVDHDLLTVQQLLGHSKPETTAIYTQAPTGAKRRMVDQAA